MFSNYKNKTTVKALIGISAYGMDMHFSDIYPDSIFDSEITAKTNILDHVNPKTEIMSDRSILPFKIFVQKNKFI